MSESFGSDWFMLQVPKEMSFVSNVTTMESLDLFQKATAEVQETQELGEQQMSMVSVQTESYTDDEYEQDDTETETETEGEEDEYEEYEDEDDGEDDDDGEDETNEDEESEVSADPTIPCNIDFVADALEEDKRYNTPYKFDKVNTGTHIDVDDAISHLNKMQELLPNSPTPPVIPATLTNDTRTTGQVSKATSKFDASTVPTIVKKDSKEHSKMINELKKTITKSDLQVLYKAVMGMSMPDQDVETREESSLQRECQSSDEQRIGAENDRESVVSLSSRNRMLSKSISNLPSIAEDEKSAANASKSSKSISIGSVQSKTSLGNLIKRLSPVSFAEGSVKSAEGFEMSQGSTPIETTSSKSNAGCVKGPNVDAATEESVEISDIANFKPPSPEPQSHPAAVSHAATKHKGTLPAKNREQAKPKRRTLMGFLTARRAGGRSSPPASRSRGSSENESSRKSPPTPVRTNNATKKPDSGKTTPILSNKAEAKFPKSSIEPTPCTDAKNHQHCLSTTGPQGPDSETAKEVKHNIELGIATGFDKGNIQPPKDVRRVRSSPMKMENKEKEETKDLNKSAVVESPCTGVEISGRSRSENLATKHKPSMTKEKTKDSEKPTTVEPPSAGIEILGRSRSENLTTKTTTAARKGSTKSVQGRSPKGNGDKTVASSKVVRDGKSVVSSRSRVSQANSHKAKSRKAWKDLLDDIPDEKPVQVSNNVFDLNWRGELPDIGSNLLNGWLSTWGESHDSGDSSESEGEGESKHKKDAPNETKTIRSVKSLPKNKNETEPAERAPQTGEVAAASHRKKAGNESTRAQKKNPHIRAAPKTRHPGTGKTDNSAIVTKGGKQIKPQKKLKAAPKHSKAAQVIVVTGSKKITEVPASGGKKSNEVAGPVVSKATESKKSTQTRKSLQTKKSALTKNSKSSIKTSAEQSLQRSQQTKNATSMPSAARTTNFMAQQEVRNEKSQVQMVEQTGTAGGRSTKNVNTPSKRGDDVLVQRAGSHNPKELQERRIERKIWKRNRSGVQMESAVLIA